MMFEISDTGPGIPPEKQKTIFDAFSQVDSSASRRFGGTGLGLAITSRLIELMHGRIELESEPGNGALFRLSLPLAAAEEDLTQPQAPEALAGLRVLIVDDHAVNRDILHNQVLSRRKTIRTRSYYWTGICRTWTAWNWPGRLPRIRVFIHRNWCCSVRPVSIPAPRLPTRRRSPVTCKNRSGNSNCWNACAT
jgi:hypothetical protein